MPSTTVLAPDLQVGDVLLACGLAGLTGRVLAVRVGREVVDVTTDAARTGLAHFEVCSVLREHVAEAS